MDVINRCTKKDGTISEAQGIAKIEDIDSNAKLKVSFVRIFGQSLFWGDYWILGLDPDYRYAVVGEPSRKYGWILSRERELSGVTMAEIDRILRNQGYDPEKFVKTAQRVE